MLKLKTRAYSCNVNDVTTGDYIEVKSVWVKIVSNTAHGLPKSPMPLGWTVTAENGKSYGHKDPVRFARATDLEEVPDAP